jgi:hypothetical protein
MAYEPRISFLCGTIRNWGELMTEWGIIRLRSSAEIHVSRNDPGLTHVQPGRMRMVIVKDGIIWAVYNRPKVKLLRRLEQGGLITEEVLELYQPRYLNQRI